MTVDIIENSEQPPRAGRHRVVEQKGNLPFLRWTGSKRKLVPEIMKWLPAQKRGYHEPFMGSAALFFSLQPICPTFLSDMNTRLTRTFGAVQREVDAVIVALKIYADAYAKHGAPFYNHVRTNWSDEMSSPELAAAFIFLNKTGFNGIYRENSSGEYNVPAGKFANLPRICDEERLRACSEALRNATIINCDFRATEGRAVAGDFVYFDSPYVPTSASADFTKYTKADFTDADQIALRDLALRLRRKGVSVLLSNSDTPRVRELYKDFEIREISRGGGMNSDTTKRDSVKELLIR